MAKLPPGSTFEACGASGCKMANPDQALALQIRLIEPTMERSSGPAPTTDQAWVRIDLKLGASDSATVLRSVKRAFPVVYAPDAGVLGVPRADNTYRWATLDLRRSVAYTELASAVAPFPPESLAALTPSGVARVDAGATPDPLAGPVSDAEGVPVWLLAVLAGAVGLGGLLGLRLMSRISPRHEPA